MRTVAPRGRMRTRVERPPPLVKAASHPIKWIRNMTHTVVIAVVLAHVAMVVVMGLYYLFFEVYDPITRAWHQAVSDPFLRHNLRDVAEGLLGGFFAQQVFWNHYRKRGLTKLNFLDRIELYLHIPNLKQTDRLSRWQLASCWVVALFYAIPGFVITLLLVKWVHIKPDSVLTIHPHAPVLQAMWDRLRNWWADSWDKKLIGYGASLFFGRRPMSEVFDDVQFRFAARRVKVGKSLRFWHPPTFQARYNELKGAAY
jgi:hypothetical protein